MYVSTDGVSVFVLVNISGLLLLSTSTQIKVSHEIITIIYIWAISQICEQIKILKLYRLSVEYYGRRWLVLSFSYVN